MIFVVVSTGHFDPLIEECARLSQKFDFFGQIGSGAFAPPFPYFRIAEPRILERHMNEAELVVSHAGTGMLSTLYHLKKPAVVVPKQRRYGEMNDGQVELAQKWGRLGMAVLCMDVKDLQSAIETCRRSPPRFPDFPRLGNHIRSFFSLESSPGLAKSISQR